MKKDILNLLDLEKKDFDLLFKSAARFKQNALTGNIKKPLEGKTLGILFDKPSTRTRISFEAAMLQLGGQAIFINARDTQIARDEPVKDMARVLTRYIDGLVIRTFSQDLIKDFAEFSTIPIINALTDLYHPCQVLSDIMTVIEKKGGYKGIKIAWVGDGNNVANSWINAAAVLGFKLSLACPKSYFPDKDILDRARKKSGSNIILVDDPAKAVQGADVIYTDVWASMGQEDEQKERLAVFKPFQVNKKLVGKAAVDVIIMHCLPAHRGEEISEDVLEGHSSVIWDQSENKLHMAKAILTELIKH